MTHPTPTSVRLRGATAALLSVGVLTVGSLATVTGAAADSSRTVDPVAGARRSLDAATQAREAAERRLRALTSRRAALSRQVSSTSQTSVEITTQMAEARRTARSRAIDAYINGGQSEQLAAVLGSAGPTDASQRTAILSNGAESAAAAADQFNELRSQNDPRLAGLALQLDSLDRDLASARNDMTQASALEADAERGLAAALATPRSAPRPPPRPSSRPNVSARAVTRAAAQVTTTVSTGPVAAPAPAAAPTDPWASLRNCESGGNYSVVSASGRYRGAYQFNQSTWESVGGTGDPATASPAEQDLRARILFESRGARAWPNCGQLLHS